MSVLNRIVVALVLAAALGSDALAQTPEEIFHQANAAYEKGDFDAAAAGYRRVIQYGVVDSRVEYNLGNACFRLGRLGEAVLHYERASRLAPGDPDIVGNLELARSRCFDRVEVPELAGPIRLLRAIQDRLGADRQAMAVLGLVWLASALIAWRSSRPGGFQAASGWTLAGILLVATVAASSWYTTHERVLGTRLAVVLEDTVDVLAGPGQNNATLFTVHEGLTVEVRSERQEWIQVSLPNGLHGWIPRDALGIV